MQTGLQAVSWTLKRVGVGLAILAGLILFAYIALVVVVVVGQAAGFGQ